MWNLKECSVSTKTSSFQAIRSDPGKARSYEKKALNETMLFMRRKKSLTHPAQDITNSHPFQPKRKDGDVRKKRRPTSGTRKSKKKSEKTGGKLKETKLFWLSYKNVLICF